MIWPVPKLFRDATIPENEIEPGQNVAEETDNDDFDDFDSIGNDQHLRKKFPMAISC